MFRAALSWDCTAGTDAVILSRHCVLVTLPNISVVVWGWQWHLGGERCGMKQKSWHDDSSLVCQVVRGLNGLWPKDGGKWEPEAQK